MTVYRPPECGFEKLEENSSVWRNLRMNKGVTFKTIVEKDHDITQMMGCTWELCKMFQEEVWDKGMKQVYERICKQSKIRGASGQFGQTCDLHVARKSKWHDDLKADKHVFMV